MESIKNEQEKEQSWEMHLDLTKYHEQRQQESLNIVVDILKYFGCQPYKKDNGLLCVSYQGMDFEMEFNGANVRIWQPVWAGIEADDPGLPLIREAVNITNYEFTPTVIMTAPNSKGFLGLLSRCDVRLHPACPENDQYLISTLDAFFDVMESVRARYQQLEAEQSDKFHPRRPAGFKTNNNQQ